MTDLKARSSPVVLIGDLVDSRLHPDRRHLHDALEAAVTAANAALTPLDPLVITLGDEFQGVFAGLGDALSASFLVRARLHPTADVRFGLGRGEVATLDPVRGVHDGPGYWAARDAIVEVEERATRPRTRTARTAFAPEPEPALRVALDCLDFVVGSMSTTTRDILGGLMDGRSQHEIADALGISASAVSQRVRRDGVGVALDSMAALGRLA